MKIAVLILILFLACSLAANLILFKKLRQKPGKGSTAYDARMLLHDLTEGGALVRVTRLAPADYFMRSPRDQA